MGGKQPGTLLNAVLYDGVLSVMSLRLMYHEIRNDSIHVFQNEMASGIGNLNLCITKINF